MQIKVQWYSYTFRRFTWFQISWSFLDPNHCKAEQNWKESAGREMCNKERKRGLYVVQSVCVCVPFSTEGGICMQMVALPGWQIKRPTCSKSCAFVSVCVSMCTLVWVYLCVHLCVRNNRASLMKRVETWVCWPLCPLPSEDISPPHPETHTHTHAHTNQLQSNLAEFVDVLR